MDLRRVTLLSLILAVSAFLIPSPARADGLVFGSRNGLVNITSGFGIGVITNDPRTPSTLTNQSAAMLSSIGTTNSGNHFMGNLGSVEFTTGTALSVTGTLNHITQVIFAPGGTINVTLGRAIGTFSAGTSLFTGAFTGNSTFTLGSGFGQGTLSGAIKTNSSNVALLALLGLPPQLVGTFTATLNDISFSQQGAGLLSDTITLSPAATVPEPTSLTMVGTGLLGFAGLLRRRTKK
jgi:hypothetical protein